MSVMPGFRPILKLLPVGALLPLAIAYADRQVKISRMVDAPTPNRRASDS